MDVIYRLGQAPAAGVLEGLPDPPCYSAVRALLRVVEETEAEAEVREVRDRVRDGDATTEALRETERGVPVRERAAVVAPASAVVLPPAPKAVSGSCSSPGRAKEISQG